ncbi:Rid family detoxifying hydrolase [Synechococcus sp. M16CYN]|uniref:Rid family detoxifying hydrolase n=1 Tax=Synechococcus sp. M16CYN TaxID=3103139 RepID=UPI0032526007
MPNQEAQAITASAAPRPIGPYSQAVLADGWLYCSGQISLEPSTGKMVGNGDVGAETHQVFKNLVAVLTEAGASLKQVVRTTVFLVDLADFRIVNEIYADMFKVGVSPARACVQVAALPNGAKVEIDCVAWLG